MNVHANNQFHRTMKARERVKRSATIVYICTLLCTLLSGCTHIPTQNYPNELIRTVTETQYVDRIVYRTTTQTLYLDPYRGVNVNGIDVPDPAPWYRSIDMNQLDPRGIPETITQ